MAADDDVYDIDVDGKHLAGAVKMQVKGVDNDDVDHDLRKEKTN